MNEANKNNQEINVKDLFFYLLSKWHWFLLSVIVFGSLAWYKYASTPFVYFRQATVIIKDPSNKTSTAGFDRYENLVNKVNVANEILQFRSKKMMQEVVKRVHADVNYKYQDGLRVNELYVKSPVLVSFPDITPEAYVSFKLRVDSKEQVTISDYVGRENAKPQTINMKDTVKVDGLPMVFSPTMYCTDAWVGKEITVIRMPLTNVAAYYLANLGIRQEADEASILTMSLKDSSPARAEDVLNMLIDVYNEAAIRDKNQVAVNTANFINERLIIISQELGGVESELEAFKRTNLIMDIGSTAGSYMTDARESNNEMLELETQIRMARYIKEYLEDQTKSNDLIPSNTGIGNASVEAQISQYNTIKLRRDKLIEDSSDSNPVVEELNSSLHAMKQSIIRAVDNMIVSLGVRRDDAISRGTNAQIRVSAIPSKEREMLSIERQQKIKESLYLFLLNRREENALTQAMADNNARVIDGASGSNSPIAPDKMRILLLGILVGLVVPGVIFLFRLFTDTFVHSRRDLKGVVNAPFLGEVPMDKEIAKNKSGLVSKEGNDMVSEALRILRTNMTFMGKKGQIPQVVTFTSFNVGAGKTFISRNLAMSFAYVKKRVLLIDMDIRKGTLSRNFAKHELGLTHYLSDSSIALDDVIYPSGDHENLDILPAGPVAPNPAELLMDERLDEMIKELRGRYDYIVIDNVPVGIIADAAIVNRIADLTIFVARAGKLDRRQLPEIEALYQEKTLTNMAVVLNGVDAKHHGYGYGYGY
ncbi:MAG: polysaccharide biosynthesis tyrosine autokinase [Bacteroidaceae bacterium]|nr:polysaccharide biosynthesis tyrosine autokinase [Bacteroidaceae bacterium]